MGRARTEFAEEGRKALAIILAADEAAQTGRTVKVAR
jgi:hypothetical protein